MRATTAKVLLTANFERNLDEVERYLNAAENLDAFDRLLDLLSDHVIPTLEKFPAIGRPISARRTSSAKAMVQVVTFWLKCGSECLYLDEQKPRLEREGDVIEQDFQIRRRPAALPSVRWHQP